MNIFSWFRPTDNTPKWTVALEDIHDAGINPQGMYTYVVTWRKGAMTMTGTYAFPTPKPLTKVLALARSEC